MRPKRLLLAAFLALVLLPPVVVPEDSRLVGRNPVGRIDPIPAPAVSAGPFRLIDAWELTGDGPLFGGFSSLSPIFGDQFLAGTDGGFKIVFGRPDRRRWRPVLSRFGAVGDLAKVSADLEALTFDPKSGRFWGAYEGTNMIRRFDPMLEIDGAIVPAAMRDWGANSGPEAFVRLADGRFVAIEERSLGWRSDSHRALIFPGDPLTGDAPMPISVEVPSGYRPVDMVPIGEAEALLLLRDFVWGFPPGFRTGIAVVDFSAAYPGSAVPARLLAELGEGFPSDNYEGMAITDDENGRHVWLISDDNKMRLQHSYLLKLAWPRQKARE